MSKKHAKSARFESCAPIMPQNAPKKNPNKIPEKNRECSWISSLYFCFDLIKEYCYSKDAIPPTGGTAKLLSTTNVFSEVLGGVLEVFNKTTDRRTPIRRIGLTCNNVVGEGKIFYDDIYEIKLLDFYFYSSF